MAEASSVAPARIRIPSWRDARLIFGVALILGSTFLGWWVVDRADTTVPIFAASTELSPGDVLGAGSLTRVEVRLGEVEGSYLSAARALPEELHVLREVHAGELVPLSALGGVDEVGVSQLTLMVDAASALSLVTGSIVDVYVNRPLEAGRSTEFQGPVLALRQISVVGIPEVRRGLGSVSGTTAVQVRVATADVQALVAAVDEGAKLTLVPTPGSPVSVN